MYYIRKFSKPSCVSKIKSLVDARQLDADFLGQDMRTSCNTLSVWKSTTLEAGDLNNAICAALLASNALETTSFIILNSEDLFKANITVDDGERGATGYIGRESLHANITGLNIGKVLKLIDIYRSTCLDAARTPVVKKGEFKRFVLEAEKAGSLNVDALQEHLRNSINRLLNE